MEERLTNTKNGKVSKDQRKSQRVVGPNKIFVTRKGCY